MYIKKKPLAPYKDNIKLPILQLRNQRMKKGFAQVRRNI